MLTGEGGEKNLFAHDGLGSFFLALLRAVWYHYFVI